MGGFDDEDIPRTGAIAPEEIARLTELTQVRRELACLLAMSGCRLGRSWNIEDDELDIGRSPHTSIHLPEDGVSRRHALIARRVEGVYVRDLKSTNGTFVNGQRVTGRLLKQGDRVQVGPSTVFRFALQDELEQRFQQHQYDSATRDGLTGCYSKTYLLETLGTEMAFGMRHDRFVSLAMIDADFFKRINDTWGHLAGDHVLAQLAAVLQSCVDKDDVLARYGGEEFAVIMRDTPPEQALIMGQRAQERVEQTAFLWQGKRLPVTVSVGIAAGPSENIQQPDELIGEADRSLYEAKRQGRNRVCAPPPA